VTAPFVDLPAVVQLIVTELADGPSVLPGIPHPWINAAFDAGVIEAGAGPNGGQTRYNLRPRPMVTS
jgi:hypothetical protein